LEGDKQLEQSWSEIQRRLRAVFPDSVYENWLAGLEPAGLRGGSLYLKAPEDTREWVRRRFGSSIEAAAREAGLHIQRIELTEAPDEATGQRRLGRWPQPGGVRSFKPGYTFDRFVLGESNRFAHAAALAVAEIPGQSYNPLFVHGPPGVGKTHLLQAIGNYTALHDTSLPVHYVTVEAFTNEFMDALQENRLSAFKAKFRGAGLLLLDDVQFLAGKQKTAEEFFHTMDELITSGGQAVLSSDCHPSEITAVDPRLRERFQSGLIVDLHPPDFETRLVILRKLAGASASPVSADVLEHMARKISSNVRALEGAFIRVLAFASLVESAISIELADRVLTHLYAAVPQPDQATAIDIAQIQRETATLLELEESSLCSPSRRREVVYARQIAMYLCRELTSRSLPTIGKEFGGRDHTTVLHAHRKITKKLLLDSTTRSLVATLTQRIQTSPQVNPHSLS
jgi:chromosomal replication initiator protein